MTGGPRVVGCAHDATWPTSTTTILNVRPRLRSRSQPLASAAPDSVVEPLVAVSLPSDTLGRKYVPFCTNASTCSPTLFGCPSVPSAGGRFSSQNPNSAICGEFVPHMNSSQVSTSCCTADDGA